VPRGRIDAWIKPGIEVASEKFAILVNRTCFVENAVDGTTVIAYDIVTA
jgi:hypothetical protein